MKSIIYSGKINIKDFDIEQIHVPSTLFLNNIVKFKDIRGFKIIEPQTDSFHEKSQTNLSSEFCQTPQEIVDNFFKKVKIYPLKVIQRKNDHLGKFRTLEFKIPTEKMNFRITEDNIIEIIFPDIKL